MIEVMMISIIATGAIHLWWPRRFHLLRRGKPLLYIEEIDYDRDGTPVMLSREWHVSEAFDVQVNRQAQTAPILSER
jgi:hypothetical protein